jgi:2',3'-cyclic-nucleotide 2'-phosphodiesterase (5'-nucleotidase family)
MMRVVVSCLVLVVCASSAFAQVDGSDPESAAEPSSQTAPEPASEPTETVETPPIEREPPADIRRELSFFLLGNINGKFADIDCRQDQPVSDSGLFYASQAAYYRQFVEQAETSGTAPIALNLGDSTFPGALPRYLLASQEGAVDFAATLNQIPFSVHALGDDELGMERAQLLNFIEGTKRVDLPLQAGNLVCNAEGGAEAICETVGTGPKSKPWQVIERDGLKIGVVTLLDPDVQKSIAKSRAAGLDFLDPKEVLPGLVEKVKKQAEADVVVVLYHMVGPVEGDDAVDLASSVSGIDLMFTNRLLSAPSHQKATQQTEQSSNHGFVVAARTGTYVVGASTGHDEAITVEVTLERDADDQPWQAASLRSTAKTTSQINPHKPTAKMLRDLGELYCADWGKSINANLNLSRPFSRVDLEQFILNVMRFSTDSEIALVNAQTFVENERFPIEKELTLSDLISFVPYGNKLYTVDVPGSVLESLAGKLDGALVAAGLEKKGDKVLVNGRPIQAGRSYQVATHGFLATGGDNVLPADKVSRAAPYEVAWSEASPTLGVLAAEFVRTNGLDGDIELTDTLDPQASFPDLHRKFLWSYTGSINSSFNKVTVDNPGGAYEQSQLNVNSATQINLEGNGEIRADSRNHAWVNKLLVQYAQARLSDDATGQTDFEETKDLIRYRGTYQYAGFRADAGGQWYVPMPFTELQVETEFTDPAEREWHKLELTGIGGAKFQLFDPLDIKIGANARRDIREPNGETTYGLNAGYTLNRIGLLDLLGKPVQFESELEYFYNDIGASNIQELRNANRLYFALLDQLFFTTTFQAFLYKTDDVGEFGTNTELTVGLNYLWDATVQSF